MARYLYVKDGFIVNIVEHPAAPPSTVDGAETCLPITGSEQPGDAFDIVEGRSREARVTASDYLDSKIALGKALRAEAAVIIDEVNDIRQWIAAFKVQVAASATLANLKTRVAALPNMPDRTLAQAKTAIQSQITSGGVD